MNVTKNKKQLQDAFGLEEEYGYLQIPPKISGRTIARLLYGNRMGCSYCFPHGWEVVNAHYKKYQRSWKAHRKTPWKYCD